MRDLGSFYMAIVVGAVILFAVALACALMLRRRRDARVELSVEALRPDPEARRHGRANRWQDWANLGLGAWLFVSPWVLRFGTGVDDLWAGPNAWTVGSMVAVVALSAIFRLELWQERLNLALGFWIFASPWIYGFEHVGRAAWDHWIVGALIFALAAWDLATIGDVSRTELGYAADKPRRKR